VTVGFENVGTAVPPYIIAAVPVGETNITLEFAGPAVDIEHGVLQNTTFDASLTGAEQGPVETLPR